MNEDQAEAFEAYWEGLIAQCERTFPEAVGHLRAMRFAAHSLFSSWPLAHMPRIWGQAFRAALAAGEPSEILWAYIIVGRWIVDWKVAHPIDDLLSTMGTTSE